MQTDFSTSVVRRCETADIGMLVGLMHDFYAEGDYPLDSAEAAASFRYVIDHPESGGAWLAEARGMPVGHIVLAVRFAMEHYGLAGYIDDLFVQPAFRRRGIARALIDAVVADCAKRGCRAMYVETGLDNMRSLALYRRVGFEPQEDGRVWLLRHL